MRPARTRRPAAAYLPLVLTLLLLRSSPRALGQDGGGVVRGESRTAAGLRVGYEYSYDHNAIVASRRSGDALIGLTSAGNLVRFALPSLRMTRQQVGPEEVTCLGDGGRPGEVIAGLADGRVCRVDPATLSLAEFTRLPSRPRWLGVRAGGLVAVFEPPDGDKPDGRRKRVFFDSAAGKTVPLDGRPSTFLLDSRGRLWMGEDNGEWGGAVTRLDPGAAEPVALTGFGKLEPKDVQEWDGVYGFHERPDGQVWAFGGTDHMGGHDAFVTRVDTPTPRRLATFRPESWGVTPDGSVRPAPEPDSNQPAMPVNQIIDGGDGGVLVFSFSDVFRADVSLKSWRRAATLKIGYNWGQPDAVGSYPSVCAVHPPAAGETAVVCATALDGYLSFDPATGKVTGHALPGQLGAGSVDRVEFTGEGTLVRGPGVTSLPWRQGPSGWESVDIAPPFPAKTDADQPRPETVPPEEHWYETAVVPGPGGVIYTVSTNSWSPHDTVATARREKGVTTVVCRGPDYLSPDSAFVTPDGQLWDGVSGGYLRLQGGSWRETPVRRDDSEISSSDVKFLEGAGPPWVLVDHSSERLGRLDLAAGGEGVTLDRVAVKDGGRSLNVFDVLAEHGGRLLVATDAGLRTVSEAGGESEPAPLPRPPGTVRLLARDGLGRLWLGGDGLWRVSADGKTLDSLEGLPMLGRRTRVESLAADPARPDGLAVGLGDRGVVLLRVEAGP